MPQDREKKLARQRRYRAKLHIAKFGPDAGDRRGRGNHAKGPNAGRWNKDRIISSHGYVKVRVGITHPLADPNGYAYEHLLVWLTAGNPAPTKMETLHHRNEERTDNRIENLEKMTRGDHNREHLKGRKRDRLGRLISKRTAGLLDGKEHNEFPE